jgi:hypothetical protein
MRFRFKVSREVTLLPDPFWIENGLRGMFPAPTVPYQVLFSY